MTKYAKNLIIAGIAVIVLTGVMLALILTDKQNTPDGSSTTTTAEAPKERISSLFEKLSYDMIMSIDVKNEIDEYTLKVKSGQLSVKGYDDYRFDSGMVDTIPENSFNATILSKPTGTDLSVYGLENPRSEVTLNFNTGEKVNLRIGDISPKSSEVYVSVDGKPYTVSNYLMLPFLADKTYYFSKEVYGNKENDEEKILERMYVNNEHGELDIITRRDLHAEKAHFVYQYMMIKPISSAISKANADAQIKAIYGLTADKVWGVGNQPDGEPVALIDFYFKQEDTFPQQMQIWKSDSEDLKYLVKFGSDPVIYGFTDDSQLPWLTIRGESILPAFTINEVYIWDYQTLTVEAGDTKLTFNCNGSGEAETFTVFQDGLGIDVTRFQDYNSYLLKGYVSEGNFSAAKGNLIVKITVQMNFGEVYNVEYYESADSALSSVAVVNGETIGIMRKAYTDVLLQNTEIMRSLTGEAINTVW